MSKKIVIINAHPNHQAFNFGLAAAYKKGARLTGAEVKEIVIADLKFNPNLQFGYQKKMELELDLVEAWEKIVWADHMVWIYPVWWGGMPALAKGFIDRVFLPGFAFKYRKDSVCWDKLLKGKTAHIITTLDQPGWYYRLVYGRPSVNQLKKSTLEFCGVKPVKVTYVGIVKTSTDEKRQQWIEKTEELAWRYNYN
jgi:putative NADPH-quinone reductase